jgi:muconolactone delta-isomerase
MKFLTIGKFKDIGLTLPPALTRQLLEASVPIANQQKKEGKILEFYWIPGAAAYVTIGECKTAEEMVKNFNVVPISAYMGYEIYPLADYNESMKIIIERLKEAEKMMPGTPK